MYMLLVMTIWQWTNIAVLFSWEEGLSVNLEPIDLIRLLVMSVRSLLLHTLPCTYLDTLVSGFLLGCWGSIRIFQDL